jgi:hypothetical protein
MSRLSKFGAAVAVGALLLLPNAVQASFFGDHPRYMHAIADLRTARVFIEEPGAPNVRADQNNATAEIDAAINEVRRAAKDDWKNTSDMPPVDAGLNHKGRLQEALKLLERTRKDISQEEDDKHAHGLRAQAILHVDNAIGFVKMAIQFKRADEREASRF